MRSSRSMVAAISCATALAAVIAGPAHAAQQRPGTPTSAAGMPAANQSAAHPGTRVLAHVQQTLRIPDPRHSGRPMLSDATVPVLDCGVSAFVQGDALESFAVWASGSTLCVDSNGNLVNLYLIIVDVVLFEDGQNVAEDRESINNAPFLPGVTDPVDCLIGSLYQGQTTATIQITADSTPVTLRVTTGGIEPC